MQCIEYRISNIANKIATEERKSSCMHKLGNLAKQCDWFTVFLYTKEDGAVEHRSRGEANVRGRVIIYCIDRNMEAVVIAAVHSSRER